MTFGPIAIDPRPQQPARAGANNSYMQRQTALSPDDSRAERTIRVLVVEDDGRLRSLLRWTLEHDRRFEVVSEAATESEAIATTAEFDVALLDIRLSGLGGAGTIDRLRRRTPEPAVVVLSDTDAIYLRHAATDEGAAAYLVRSVDLPNLGDRLSELCASRFLCSF
jgi:DNA-binding NarL/FixJ family response regulator